jgi:hypothetical protein
LAVVTGSPFWLNVPELDGRKRAQEAQKKTSRRFLRLLCLFAATTRQ